MIRIDETRIVFPPELRFTSSGRSVCTFTIDHNGKTSCEAWEKLAERIADKNLLMGDTITVTGYYKLREYRGHSYRSFVVTEAGIISRHNQGHSV